MTRNFCLFMLGLVVVLAGCQTPPPREPDKPWGEPYADVVVPESYKPYNTPPFRREDGADGRRIFGRYAYKSTKGLAKAGELAAWFKIELPKQGWQNQLDEVDESKGTATLRYQKDNDKLVLRLAPDQLVDNNERFSILIVEMNPPYGN